jgi:putative membrane protein
MMFLPLLLLIGLVVLAVWLYRQRYGMSDEGPSGRSRALELLRERYAKGELTKEQYEQMRQDITKEQEACSFPS